MMSSSTSSGQVRFVNRDGENIERDHRLCSNITMDRLLLVSV
jgi:hypothetical protein